MSEESEGMLCARNARGGLSAWYERKPNACYCMVKPTQAFTLIELLMLIAVVAILAVIAFSSFSGYVERSKQTQAMADIMDIELLIGRYQTSNDVLPAGLSDINMASKLDPWGNPYQYVNHSLTNGKSGWRKDKKLNPINSDYDLFSMGKDGQTVGPLTAPAARDDIVRANDGSFVGLASSF